MKILLGDTRSRRNLEILQHRGWGRMCVVNHPKPYPFEPWGFDNGAFTAWTKGLAFPTERFQERLDHVLTNVASEPYIAVTPDIVAGGLHSLDFSLTWRMKLPNSWPWYLAVQDGMEVSDVEPHLNLFAGLFLGGSDKFKATAFRWSKLAHHHGKKFHYGRASTPRKLMHSFRVGSDSIDSSFPLWTNERMKIFGYAVSNLGCQQEIVYESLQ